MKLKNSTAFQDWFLRRMVSWVASKVGLPMSKIRAAQFTRYRGSYRGSAWSSMRFLVRIGTRFPMPDWDYCGNHVLGCHDPFEGLISVTAHELHHLAKWNDCGSQGTRTEVGTCWDANRLLELFRTERESLLTAWQAEPSYAMKGPTVTLVERNRTKAIADLARWQRKLKLAQTKVRKLKAKVRRYETTSAASPVRS